MSSLKFISELNLAAYLLFFLLLAGVVSCSKTDQEQAVYNLIDEGIALAESHKLGEIMDMTEEGFTAGPGKHSRTEVRRILFVMLKRYGRFRIHYPQPSVRISDDEQFAVVKMNFLVANRDELFPDLALLYEDASTWLETVDKNADIYTLSMELTNDTGEWLIQRARITRYGRPHGSMR